MVSHKASQIRVPVRLCLHAYPVSVYTVYLVYSVFDDNEVKPQSELRQLYEAVFAQLLEDDIYATSSHMTSRDTLWDWQRLQTSSTSWMQMEGIPLILQDAGEEFLESVFLVRTSSLRYDFVSWAGGKMIVININTIIIIMIVMVKSNNEKWSVLVSRFGAFGVRSLCARLVVRAWRRESCNATSHK